MTAALVLFGYAALLTTVGAGLLRRARWPERAPRLGVTAWQVLSASALGAVVLGGLALVVPSAELSTDLAALLEACTMALRTQYATPVGAAGSIAGATLAVAVIARAGYCLGRGLLTARRQRRRQAEVLALIGRPDQRLGALIIDHGIAVAYCLPGRTRRVVLTSAAVASLDDDQLAAVLAHEAAHLRGRHHLVLAMAAALTNAFPFVPGLRHAHTQIARLVEMLADDAAARRCDRLTVATALVALAEGHAPTAALAAGGPTALARVRRLVSPARPLGALRTTFAATVLAAALVFPVVAVAAPALAAAALDYCPIDLRIGSFG
ncbi:MAG: M56 family metallopeptidase [Dehalococcoidia bacterium]